MWAQDVNNSRTKGVHFILYSQQNPTIYFNLYRAKSTMGGGQDWYVQPHVTGVLERRMAAWDHG